MSQFDMTGRRMVITGATSGIGRGLVDHFVDRGADIGAAIQYLASDHAEMANGHTLMVDGGRTIV